MITSSDVSIVIQGAYYKPSENNYDTKLVVMGWRQAFPNAEIILSCWENQDLMTEEDLADLKVNIVLSKDPGPDYAGSQTFNLNRQIISTAAGISKASRDYIIKSRTDVLIDSNLFMRYYQLHLKHQKTGFAFSKPIAIYSLSTRNWKKGFIPHLFHPCDWFYLGSANDLRRLFDSNSYPTEDLLYFKKNKKPRRNSFSGLSRFIPEQYILVDYLFRQGVLQKSEFENYGVTTRSMRKMNFSIFKSDFLVLDEDQIGLKSKKYPEPHSRNIQISQLRHEEWAHYTNQVHLPSEMHNFLYIRVRLFKHRLVSLIGTIEFFTLNFKRSMIEKVERNRK